MTSAFGFARRKNHDCSIDSICVKCYQTIASAENANKLAAEEQIHICNPFGEFNFQQAAASLPYSGSVALRKEKSLGARLAAHRSCPGLRGRASPLPAAANRSGIAARGPFIEFDGRCGWN